MVALPEPGASALLSHWTVQPVALLVAVALVALRVRAGRRRPGVVTRGRTITFAVGVALLVWTTNGFPAAYASSLFWVWTSQILTLWLVVPPLLLSGHLVQLAEAAGLAGWTDRVLSSRLGRIVSNPFVAPALLPALSGFIFFGPLPTWSIRYAAVAWSLQLALLVLGVLMMVPLLGPEGRRGSLAVGLALAIGAFELVLDAVPGVVLRLHESLVTSFFDYRHHYPWSPSDLHDQQIAGSILWCIAEVIDLPFLVIVFRRWLSSDAREAAEVDAVLDAERIARGEVVEPTSETIAGDKPWWLDDPQLRDRFPFRRN